MKHLKKYRKFSREKKQREALMKIMLGNLFSRTKMTTTLAKAKELKIFAEKTITRIKKNPKSRVFQSELPQNISSKNIEEIALKTVDRKSGFLRIIRKGPRISDGAQLAIIEFVDEKKTLASKNNEKK
jgi:large subunit ribosomal protein L17